ncbi:hypothetical protein F5148DRAFT_1175863 [Russula earlei]|uniref:Uncharacterized protein n=1 Tax=Russula earlei TaxID=71964 RepID=A0ACC0UIG6_9AGAM|nr:hypothetical protein F5148DRAFT_1175863 [Russula earlei]
MDSLEDTDTLLALLSSLLPDNVAPSQQSLLDALLHADGDVRKAAEIMLKRGPTGKRKRHVSLDSWLTPAAASSSSKDVNGQSSSRDNSDPVLQSRCGAGERPNKKPRSSAAGSTSTATKKENGPPPLSKPVKPVKNLLDVLRQPIGGAAATATVPRLPPLTLSNPSLVAQHTPLTLHLAVLPLELACQLFYTMLHEAQYWSRNKWWLFDRLVESPHRSSLYTRHPVEGDNEAAWQRITRAWYNGRQGEVTKQFPALMEEACKIVEKTVNAEMGKRKRFPLEWGGDPGDPDGQRLTWRANFAAANCYEGAKEAVGFHSDRLTSIGPYPTIASLSLGTRRMFRLREVIALDEVGKRAAQTFDIPLPHNSLCIMHASAQERFKHSIPPRNTIDRFHPPYPPPPDLPELAFDPGNCRINITFRFFRPDFHPDTIPRCKCDEMTTLRPDMKGRQRGWEGEDGKGPPRSPVASGGAERATGYWWTCTAGDQNEGKGCGFWKVMDVRAEGRGPFVSDLSLSE